MTQPIGIFGGTFDPVHFGHLRPALELLEDLALVEVRMLPCRVPPHREQPVATPEQRLAMLKLAIAGQPGLSVDERELRREGGASYMVDTLASLRSEFPQRPLCLLLGLDAFLGLGGWHRWQELFELAHIVVTHRPGWHLDEAPASPALQALRQRRVETVEALSAQNAGYVLLHPVTQLAISATAIREAIAAGRSARYLLPETVWQYLIQQGLYR